jgi:hypothetical protein
MLQVLAAAVLIKRAAEQENIKRIIVFEPKLYFLYFNQKYKKLKPLM